MSAAGEPSGPPSSTDPGQAAGAARSASPVSGGLWGDFQSALTELTIIGKPADPSRLAIGRSAVFYPLIGFLIGLAASALDWVLRTFLSQEITSVLIVGALAAFSAGRQLDGFANTADGVIGFRGREWAIATIRDRRIGSSGAAAIAFLLILKVRGLDLLSDPTRFLGILLPPMIARLGILVLAFRSRAAGATVPNGLFDPEISSREIGLAAGFAVIVTLATSGALGLLVLILGGLSTLGFRFYFDRRLGGVTAQSLDAAAEALETLALIVFALGS